MIKRLILAVLFIPVMAVIAAGFCVVVIFILFHWLITGKVMLVEIIDNYLDNTFGRFEKLVIKEFP